MKIDVAKVAKLANLPLTPDEEKKYAQQLSKILDYVDQLNHVPTHLTSKSQDLQSSGQASKVGATYNVFPNSNVMRPDEPSESLSQEDATSNAANVKGGFIVSKGVFEKEA